VIKAQDHRVQMAKYRVQARRCGELKSVFVRGDRYLLALESVNLWMCCKVHSAVENTNRKGEIALSRHLQSISAAMLVTSLIVPYTRAAQAMPSALLVAHPDMAHVGAAIPRSFLGLSIEWGLINRMIKPQFGRQKTMIRLLKLLSRYNGPPLLRIGGNSQDEAAYNLPAERNLPKFVHVNISNHTLRLLATVARATDCRYVIGLNLAVNRPALAVRLVRATRRIIGDRYIAGYEIGNEPDFFHRFGGIWAHNSFALYIKRWTRYYHAIEPVLPAANCIEGPAFGGSWLRQVPTFIRLEHRRLAIVSLHRYPLGATVTNPHSPVFCSIGNLLKNSAAESFAQLMMPSLAAARPYHLPVRYGEMNSAWNGGKLGVSNTMASALWGADTLFAIAQVGGAGVNLHNSEGFDHFPGYYGPVYFQPHGPIQVRPLFYAMLVFARATQEHARLVPVAYRTNQNVKLWAALAANGELRIVVINKSRRSARVQLKRPGTLASQRYREYSLSAPSISASTGMKLGGMTFDGGKNGRMTGRPEVQARRFTSNSVVIDSKPYSMAVIVLNLASE
jgi:hypothetical protein